MLPISISGFGDAKVKSAIFKVGEVVRSYTNITNLLYLGRFMHTHYEVNYAFVVHAGF